MDKYKDLVVFGKIMSTGFLIAGYVFLGVLLSRKLVSMGWPPWLNAALPAVMAVFGLSQGWFMVREFMRKK